MTRQHTVKYKGVPVLKPGTYTDMHGRRASFSAGDLEQLAGSFDPRLFKPSVNIDHADSGPALGSVEGLRWDGEYLRADLANVPGELAAQIDNGRYPHRSAEIYPDLDGKGAYLRALALLGARPPAVKGLPPMPSAVTPGPSTAPLAGAPASKTTAPTRPGGGNINRNETMQTVNFTHSTIGGTDD